MVFTAHQGGTAFGSANSVTINQTLPTHRGLSDAPVSPQVAQLTPIMGRADDLAALRAAFTTASPGTPVVRALTGMGGVGKSSLARAYAHRHREDYGLVGWIRAEDPAAIDAEFRQILEILDPANAKEIQDAVSAVHALLATQTQPWLLILDNVTDPTAVHGLIPATGSGHVLITSQATHWPQKIAVAVRPLDENTAVALLGSLSPDDDRDTARTLAVELGCLPLTLVQAGSFARANRMPLTTYLRLYRTQRAELHRDGKPDDDYPHTIATTWHLAIGRLSGPARALLNLLCCYAPDAIPVTTLLTPDDPSGIALPEAVEAGVRPLLEDELTRHRALGELLAYSLITTTDSQTATLVSVHRLIQAVTIDLFPFERPVKPWPQTARALLTAAMPQEPVTATTLTLWNTLHTHTHALLDHLPPNDPDTLTTRNNLADWTGMAGDAAGARDLLAALLPVRERVLGTEHPDTLSIRHNLAGWTGEVGDATGARDLFAALLPVQERILGTEHPNTLNTRNNLAYWTREAGDASARSSTSRRAGPKRPSSPGGVLGRVRRALLHFLGNRSE